MAFLDWMAETPVHPFYEQDLGSVYYESESGYTAKPRKSGFEAVCRHPDIASVRSSGAPEALPTAG